MVAGAKPFVVPVFIPHAGCPHRCLFCDQRRTTGQPATIPTAKAVHDTIAEFLSYRRDRNRWTEISFFGGNFLGLEPKDIRFLLTLATTYVNQGKVDGIRFSTRPDTVDGHRLQTIADFPITTVEVGVQSMNDAVLSLNRRGHSAETSRQALILLKQQMSYRIGAQIMVGLPGDTFANALNTGHQVAALAPDFVRIYPTLVLQGSLLESWHTQGRYQPLTLDQCLAQTKDLYRLFAAKKIRVIRMGLQPTAELNPSAGVVAGPFHPAFGELVVSALWIDALQHHLAQHGAKDGKITIQVHSRGLSQLKGQKNKNIATLMRNGMLKRIEVLSDDALPADMAMVNGYPCAMLADPEDPDP